MFLAQIRKLSHFSSKNYQFTAVKNRSLLHGHVIIMKTLESIGAIKGIGLQILSMNSEKKELERLTFCNKFYENPLIYKKVIEVLKIPIV